MNYISTRNKSLNFDFSSIFLRGLAPDGGLFIPNEIQKFNETYNNNDINGQNKLVLKTLKKLIVDFLKNELNLINSGHEIKIIDIEKPFDYNLRISKSLPPIKLVGKIDRIDIFDGEIRIIDYKTGIIKSGNMVLKNFDQSM